MEKLQEIFVFNQTDIFQRDLLATVPVCLLRKYYVPEPVTKPTLLELGDISTISKFDKKKKKRTCVSQALTILYT